MSFKNLHSVSILHIAESENVSADSVFHLDAFLYDDELEQSLLDEGKISRTVCKKCRSRDTQPLSKLWETM